MTCNLREFVGRTREIELFDSLLAHPTHRVMLVQGGGGIGKSCLLFRLRRTQGREPGAPLCAVLDFRADSDLSQSEWIIRRLREQLGGHFDQKLGQAEMDIQRELAQSTLPQSLMAAVPAGGAPAGSLALSGDITANDIIVGNKITIRNSTLVFNPGGGADVLQAEVEQRRNRAFRAALLDLVATQKLILFIDHYELAGKVAQRWLIDQLLALPLYDGDLCENLWVVVGGQQVPFQEQIDQWRHVLQRYTLPPLTQEEVHLFWAEKRKLDPAQTMIIALTSGGNPGLLFMMANNFQDALSRGAGG